MKVSVTHHPTPASVPSFVNLTPHTVYVRDPDGRETTIPVSGSVARVATLSRIIDVLHNIDIVTNDYGKIEGLPVFDANDNSVYIVSMMVLAALVTSTISRPAYVIAPDSGPTAVRDPDGQIEYVTQFVRNL